MTDKEEMKWIADCMKEGGQSAMERALIDEYLASQGYCMADLKSMSPQRAKAIMTKACEYASLKLAQMESKAGFRDKIRS